MSLHDVGPLLMAASRLGDSVVMGSQTPPVRVGELLTKYDAGRATGRSPEPQFWCLIGVNQHASAAKFFTSLNSPE
jgi:hypothetical protein